jgi:hypothetical protein
MQMSQRFQVHFFASRADLTPGLQKVEQQLELKYVLDFRYVPYIVYESPNAQIYNSAFDIPTFGQAKGRRSDIFIVMPRRKRIIYSRIVEIPKYKPGWLGIRPGWRRDLAVGLAMLGIKLPGGKIRYEVIPSHNSGSIVFSPGGMHDDATLIAGEIGIVNPSKKSRQLYKQFAKEILTGFEKIKSFMVGPEAQQLLDKGVRLTMDVEASSIADLKR